MPGRLVFETTADGSNALSERMRITSNGNVGINDVSPESLLHINKSVSTAYSASATDAQRGSTATLNITNDDTTNNSFAQIAFRNDGTNQSIARIAAIKRSTNSSHLAFVTEHGATPAETMRITSDGFIGVGGGTPASNPRGQFVINSEKNANSGTTNPMDPAHYHLVLKNDNDTNDEAIGLCFSASSTVDRVGAAIIHQRDNAGSVGSLKFFTSPSEGTTTERLRITSGGVALFNGLTSQTADTSKLAVQGGDSNIGIIQVHAGGGESDGDLSGITFSHGSDNQTARAKGAIALRCNGSGYGRGDLCFYVDGTGDNNQVAVADERMRITSAGELQHYSPSDAVQNFKFRSDDVNWHGYLNQSVEGGSISTILSNSGQWTVDGTTYAATKDYTGAFSTGAFIIHNQYNSAAGNATFAFLSKASGSSTTDGAISHYYTINASGQHYWGDNATTIGNQDSNKFVFSGTKAYSGGIVQQQLAVVDASAYNTTDNGGSIGFQAKYNSGGAYTQMASCGGLKSNNTDGNYEGRFQIKVRNHVGNSIEYVSIEPTSSKFRNSLTTESELNMIRDNGTPANKYMDIGYLNNTFHIRRTSGGDGGHAVHMTIASNGTISGVFNNTSDEKLKDNIVSIADGSLALVKQLRPVTFDWKDSTRPNNQTGFVAQELKAVIPNLINGTEYDETEVNEKGQIISTGYSINTTGVVAHLTKALQELSAKNDALEARIAALEGS